MAGLGIPKTPEGAEALRKLSRALIQENDNINSIHDTLKRTYDDVGETLAHNDEIEALLEEIRTIQSDAITSITTLSDKASSLATMLDNFLNSGLGGSGNP